MDRSGEPPSTGGEPPAMTPEELYRMKLMREMALGKVCLIFALLLLLPMVGSLMGDYAERGNLAAALYHGHFMGMYYSHVAIAGGLLLAIGVAFRL